MRIDRLAGLGVALAGLIVSAVFVDTVEAKTVRRRVQRRTPKASATTGARTFIQMGVEHLNRQEFSAAILSFQKACRAGGASPAYFLLGYAYYQRGFLSGDPDNADKQDALEVVNAYTTAIALDPSLSEVQNPYKLYHSLALSYETLGNYNKAAEAYRQAMIVSPRNPMLPLYAARLRYRMSDVPRSVSNLALSLERAKAAGQLSAVLKVLQTDPKFSMMLTTPSILDEVRRYDRSIAPPQSAPQAPATAEGDAYALRDSVAATKPADPRGAALREQDKAVLDALASANDELKFRRYRQAITLYQEALDLNEGSGVLNPTQSALILERMGTAYNKLGQANDAIRSLLHCLQKAPMATAAHYQLALAYSLTGRFRDSLHSLNETLRSAPSTGELRRYMLLAKTDPELEPVRDLPGFHASLAEHRQRALGR